MSDDAKYVKVAVEERDPKSVSVFPLHGKKTIFDNPAKAFDNAIAYVWDYEWKDNEGLNAFVRFEIAVDFEDGDIYNVSIANKQRAVAFLKKCKLGIL